MLNIGIIEINAKWVQNTSMLNNFYSFLAHVGYVRTHTMTKKGHGKRTIVFNHDSDRWTKGGLRWMESSCRYIKERENKK